MSFGSLISKLGAVKTSKEAVEVYKQLCEWLEKNSPQKERKLEQLVLILKKHMVSPSGSVSSSSMKACGYMLKHISVRLSDEDENALLERICKATDKHTSKTAQYHGCWCLAMQRLPPAALIRNFQMIFKSLIGVLVDIIDSDERELIDKEAMQALSLLCENCPNEMKDHALSDENGAGWISVTTERFVGKGSSRSSSARKLFQKGFHLVLSTDSTVQLKIAKETLKTLQGGLLGRMEIAMKEQMPNEATQVEVLKIWGYLLLLLKERTLFKDSKFLNRLLAIVNTAFLHPSIEIQMQAFDSWRYFLCVVASNTPRLLRHKQRLSIALSPSIRALTKNTNLGIRKAAYTAFSQLINSIAPHSSTEGESVLCSVFDEVLKPLYPKIIQNPVNDENSPELIPYVLELFANILYTNFKPIETNFVLEEILLNESEDDIPMLSVDVEISAEFIHQRLSFFLELLAYCLNRSDSTLYQQDCKANLLSIWENIILRVFASLEDPKGKAEAMSSIKKLIVFPFSYPATSQYPCNNWTVVIREELLTGLISQTKPQVITSSKYKLSWRAESVKLPIAVFLCCCWIQSVREGLCGQEAQIEKEITCSVVSKCQLSVFRSLLQMIHQHNTEQALENFATILRQLVPTERSLPLDDLIPLWSTFAQSLTEYVKETNNTGVNSDAPQCGHSVFYHALQIPLSGAFNGLQENQIAHSEILSLWEQLFVAFRAAITIKSLHGEWKSFFINCLPDITCSTPTQIAIWTKLAEALVSSIHIPSNQSKKQIAGTLDCFGPTIAIVFQNIHNSIQYKETSTNSPSGLFLLQQGVKMVETIISLFSALSHFKKQKFIIIAIQKLREPFLIWFSNPKPRSSDLTAGECDKLRSSIEKLWKSFADVIQTCRDPCQEEQLLFGIEYMLTAAFKSKFRWLKSAAVKLWNKYFKEYSSDYPPGFYELLQSLKKHCDIIVPMKYNSGSGLGVNASLESITEEDVSEDILDSLPIPEISDISSYSSKATKKAVTRENVERAEKAAPPVEIEEPSEFLAPDPRPVIKSKPKVSDNIKKSSRQPLTEHQKEKRREQQQTAALYSSVTVPATLTTQEISDEIWGCEGDEIVASAPSKKRKLEHSTLSIYNKPKVDFSTFSAVDYVELIKQLGNEENLPGQLSAPQLISVQRSINKLMNTLINKLDDDLNEI